MTRAVHFSEKDVEDWCESKDDPNPLHTDPEAASNGPFGERVVPGIMVLDYLSGALTRLGEEGETIILAGITAARFRDPVFFDETVTYELEILDDEDGYFTSVQFDCRVEARDTLVATGVASIVIT
jgi:acyl dehydratase